MSTVKGRLRALFERTKKFQPSEKLTHRCDILAKAVRPAGRLYLEANRTQRDLLESTVAAAIWYLPPAPWSGNISRKALKLLEAGTKFAKLTKEHPYPRKRAGRDLLSMKANGLDGKRMLKLYLEKFGQWNFVTPEENRALKHHAKCQRTGLAFNIEKCYAAAGIELINFSGK